MSINIFSPDWPVNDLVKACTTTRHGGVSVAPYGQLNLATHVGDLPAAVQENRRRLVSELELPGEPNWLSQTHSDGLVRIDANGLSDVPDADASYTNVSEQVLVIMTADCLPIFLATRDGSELAMVHAGWRGLANGIIDRTLQQFSSDLPDVCAWIGPAISGDHYEVGNDVRQAILRVSEQHENAFVRHQGQWLADLPKVAHQQLSRAGIGFIGGGQYCTFADRDNFYSYRRDGTTGRMASLMWRTLSG